MGNFSFPHSTQQRTSCHHGSNANGTSEAKGQNKGENAYLLSIYYILDNLYDTKVF